MRLVDKSKERKRGGPKKKSESRFVWEGTPKDPALFEFSENPGLMQDMPQNAYAFDILNLLLTEELLHTLLNKTNE